MIIDRFEGDYAIIETDEGFINVYRAFLPANAREGDVVVCSNGGYYVDQEATDSIRSDVKDRLHKLLTGKDD